MITLDAVPGESAGQVLRTALALSAATGQAFEMKGIRARRPRAGLAPAHLAAVRAASLVCGARVHGAFEGSPDLRFEPGAVTAGDFGFELEGPGAVTLVLQTVVPVLATAPTISRIDDHRRHPRAARPDLRVPRPPLGRDRGAPGPPLLLHARRRRLPPARRGRRARVRRGRLGPPEPARPLGAGRARRSAGCRGRGQGQGRGGRGAWPRRRRAGSGKRAGWSRAGRSRT